MIIEHPDQIGRTAAALELLSRRAYRATVNGNNIKVETGPGSLQEFQTEEEYMVWMLNEINSITEIEIQFFREKHGVT